jgi:low temperature requirement protein LtrA
VSDADREAERDEHHVTPLELFFDLTFVFAMTQVTVLLAGVCALVVAWEALRYRESRVT